MNKSEFIVELRKKLSSLSANELEERIDFYGEMVDDRIEDGLSEEEAVLDIGSIDDIANQIITEAGEKIKKPKVKRRLKGWEIALLAIGSPLWFTLLIAALAILFAVYIVLWVLVVSVWAIFVSFVCSGFLGVVCGIAIMIDGYPPVGVALMGAGLILIGLSILLFFGGKASIKGALRLSKNIILCIKNSFWVKEKAQ